MFVGLRFRNSQRQGQRFITCTPKSFFDVSLSFYDFLAAPRRGQGLVLCLEVVGLQYSEVVEMILSKLSLSGRAQKLNDRNVGYYKL